MGSMHTYVQRLHTYTGRTGCTGLYAGAAIAEVREGATRALTRGTMTGIGHMYVETGNDGLELSMACSLNYGAICKVTCALTHTDIV